MTPQECPHSDFKSRIAVNKIEDGNIIIADISIECIDCGAEFCFQGLNAGVDPKNPSVSVLGTELRVPAKLIHEDGHTGQYDVEG